MQTMEFSNENVAIGNVPNVDELVLQALSPKYRNMNIIVTLIFWGGVSLVLAGVVLQTFVSLSERFLILVPYLFIAIMFFATWSVLFHFFADPKKAYVLREQDVHFQSGLIFRKLVSQPILRIQHIELKKGPIERLAKLATLQVFSAGGAMHTFQIPGLAETDAIKLRQFILDHKDFNLHG